MRIKMLSRNPDDYLRETKHDIYKMPRNYAPEAHPMSQEREYVRALNATKLDRVFARPFIASLDGHTDGVSCLRTHPSRLASLLSTSFDGELRLWNLSTQKCVRSVQAHSGGVRGMSVQSSTSAIITVGDDNHIKTWAMSAADARKDGIRVKYTLWRRCKSADGVWNEPVSTIVGKTAILDVSCSWADGTTLATCGDQVDIWDGERAAPVRSFTWGCDSHIRVAYAPIETTVLASLAVDRSIILYDSRADVPLRRVIMKLKSNAISWNPMEAMIFTVASDDYNLYTFDMRKLAAPINVHMDHTAAVTDVCYAPTGREFVSGSVDQSLRIWSADKGRSREVYHTKRMHRVQCVTWTLDNKYILSGSDEMNIRLWKANASEKLAPTTSREARAMKYNDALREKYAALPQVARIARHRQVPKHIYHAQQEHRIIRQSRKRKEANVRAHSKPGTVPYEPERRAHTVKEEQ